MDVLIQSLVPALAKALGHFIWQGAVLGLAAYAITSLVPRRASMRYTVLVVCLIGMAVMPVVTTLLLMVPPSPAIALEAGHLELTSASLALSTGLSSAGSAPPTASWNWSAVVVALWLTGALALSLRLFGGWVIAQRFAHRTRDLVSSEVRQLAQGVAERLAITRLVRILQSPTIGVPMMVGWIKPVVILPTAALAGLTPVQVEALLAHELAHIRRHDYLVNLLQSVIESVLFYHPAVWWISRQVREAREQCCDDLAVGICDRIVYASALADLAAMAGGPRLALAATDGSLIARVRRILGVGEDLRRPKAGWLPAALVVLTMAGLGPIVLMSASARPQSTMPQTAQPAQGASQATPAVQPAPTTPVQPAVAPQPAPKSPEEPEHAQQSNDRTPTPEQADRFRVLEKRLEELRVHQGDLDGLREEMAAKLAKLEAAINGEVASSAGMDEARIRALKQRLEDAQRMLELDKEQTLKAFKKMTDQAAVDKETTKADIAQLNAEAATVGENAKELTNELKLKLSEAKQALDETYLEDEAALAGGAKTYEGQGAISLLRIVADKAPGRVLVVSSGDVPNELTSAKRPSVSAAVSMVDWREGLTAAQALEQGKQAKMKILVQGSTPSSSTGGSERLSRLVGVNVSWEEGQVRADVRTEPIDRDTMLHNGDVVFVGSPIR